MPLPLDNQDLIEDNVMIIDLENYVSNSKHTPPDENTKWNNGLLLIKCHLHGLMGFKLQCQTLLLSL